MACEMCMPCCIEIKDSVENDYQVALPVVCLYHYL